MTWHKITEKPPLYTELLCCNQHGNYWVATAEPDKHDVEFASVIYLDGFMDECTYPTHWMLLPPLPTEE